MRKHRRAAVFCVGAPALRLPTISSTQTPSRGRPLAAVGALALVTQAGAHGLPRREEVMNAKKWKAWEART
jgi:hypothetical protein